MSVVKITRVITSSVIEKHSVFLLFVTLLFGCDGGTDLSNNAYSGLVTIKGSIEVAADTSIDADVEATCEELTQKNNADSDAQIISNPLTIGGYLSGIAFNNGECLEYETDIVDIYRVSLVEDQTLSLSIFPAHDDRQSLNATLVLREVDTPDNVVSEITINEEGAKSLVVGETSEYYVDVKVISGADPLLYTLSLSLGLSAESASLFHQASTMDFVPGEVLLVDQTANNFSGTKITKHSPRDLLEEYDLKFERTAGERSKLYQFNSLDSGQFKVKSASYFDNASRLEKKWKTLELIQAINEEGGARKAEPNYYRKAAFVPNDERYSDQWNLSALNLEQAWDRASGHGVVIAVIDSGINPGHEDLKNQLTSSGYDFIASTEYSGDGDGFDSDPTDLSDAQHGAHVAGIIAAQTNNLEGIAGIAFDARIMALRVLGIENDEGVGQGTDADLANAILYAGGLENDSGLFPTRTADIINLSLGGEAYSDTLKQAVEAVIAKGIIVVAASGNEASSESFYPASFDGVVSVSAVDTGLQLSSFSNFGESIDVAAPGGAPNQRGILSTVAGNQYRQYYGTSMAAPHISGVAALMKSVNPDLSASLFSYALERGLLTDVIGDENSFGAGLINASKAVAWAAGDNSTPDTLYYFPKSFSFSNKSLDATLYLSNPGSGSVVVSGVDASSEDTSWLDVTQNSVDKDGLGIYNIEVNSAAIPINTFKKGSLIITYRINDQVEETLSLKVLASNTISGNETVGNLFVSLISTNDVATGSSEKLIYPVAEVAGALSNGVYDYTFRNVSTGEYYIRASTNNDGDEYLFDSGEALGVYPSISTISTVKADKALVEGVDFSVRFYESNLKAAQSLIRDK